MNLGIVVLEYARAIREEKIHWWDNLVIQYFQELSWLAVPRPDQLKQPQIITLQFADLNQNYKLFLARQCMAWQCSKKGIWRLYRDTWKQNDIMGLMKCKILHFAD